MQRMVAQIPGLQDHLAGTQMVDGSAQGLATVTQSGMVWLMTQLHTRGKLRQLVVKKKMNLAILNTMPRPDGVNLVEFAQTYHANLDAGLPGDTETLGWMLMVKLRLTAMEETTILSKISDNVTVETVVDAVILFFSRHATAVIPKSSAAKEEEEAIAAWKATRNLRDFTGNCDKCGEVGHFARDCKNSRVEGAGPPMRNDGFNQSSCNIREQTAANFFSNSFSQFGSSEDDTPKASKPRRANTDRKKRIRNLSIFMLIFCDNEIDKQYVHCAENGVWSARSLDTDFLATTNTTSVDFVD